MSTTVPAIPVPPASATSTPARDAIAPVGSLLLVGSAAAATAAAATAILAVVGHAVGVSTDMAGAPIPASGFAVMTVVFSILGLVIAAALRRFASHPRTAWIRVTVVLTALSFVPDLLAEAAAPTKALLMLAHVVAAAIVIPAVARRLS